jgi:3-oxoacyl-[acyl-carrier protein] reductase
MPVHQERFGLHSDRVGHQPTATGQLRQAGLDHSGSGQSAADEDRIRLRRALKVLRRIGANINIGSEVVARAVPNFVPYVAAKSGQNGFTRSMSQELAPWNITVNMISPGWIPVERHVEEVVTDGPGYRVLIPLDRWGIPEDVSGTAIYLSSDASSFVTGQNIHVNGGMTTQGC